MLNKKLVSSRQLNGPAWLLLAGASVVLALVMLPTGLVAQDNDQSGELPFNNKQEGNTDSTLAMAGTYESQSIDEFSPVVSFAAPNVAVTVAAGVAVDEAEFIPSGAIAMAQPQAELLMQGSGTLNAQIGLQIKLHSAELAVARAAVLVLDDGQASLASMLAGEAMPPVVISLGDPTDLDLVAFDKLVQKFEGSAPAFRATVVFLALDVWGTLHMTAVAGSTSGGPLEIATY